MRSLRYYQDTLYFFLLASLLFVSSLAWFKNIYFHHPSNPLFVLKGQAFESAPAAQKDGGFADLGR